MFTIMKSLNQPRYPSVVGGIKNEVHIIHIMEYYSIIKIKILFPRKQMELEILLLN